MPALPSPDVRHHASPDPADDSPKEPLHPLHAYDLVYLLGLAFQQVLQDFVRRLHAAGYTDLRPIQAFALQVLSHEGATSVELAARLGTTKQGAGQLIDYLEAQGYVERQAHPRGGRRRLIVLNRRGHGYVADVAAIMRTIDADGAAELGDARLDDLRRTLVMLIQANSPDGPPPLRPVW